MRDVISKTNVDTGRKTDRSLSKQLILEYKAKFMNLTESNYEIYNTKLTILNTKEIY